MELLTPEPWADYDLIDTGGFEKLERFGAYIIRRPEPQAIWQKSLSEEAWLEKADARFDRLSEKQRIADGNEQGNWQKKANMPDQWQVSYHYKEMSLKFRLGLTGFKHVGIFPEQAVNWNFIYDTIKQTNEEQPSVLNLFAYTGGASLAACSAGAKVVHVDSVRQVIHWAKQNMELSGLNSIQWVVEDALKFVRRETRRNHRYTGIILDPPAYGRGPDGEKWIIEKDLDELLQLCSRLLLPNGFIIINVYSLGWSALILENLFRLHFSDFRHYIRYGELFLPDSFGNKLPLGSFLYLIKTNTTP